MYEADLFNFIHKKQIKMHFNKCTWLSDIIHIFLFTAMCIAIKFFVLQLTKLEDQTVI